MREFLSYKENINIREFVEAANTMDDIREHKKEEAKHKKG